MGFSLKNHPLFGNPNLWNPHIRNHSKLSWSSSLSLSLSPSWKSWGMSKGGGIPHSNNPPYVMSTFWRSSVPFWLSWVCFQDPAGSAIPAQAEMAQCRKIHDIWTSRERVGNPRTESRRIVTFRYRNAKLPDNMVYRLASSVILTIPTSSLALKEQKN